MSAPLLLGDRLLRSLRTSPESSRPRARSSGTAGRFVFKVELADDDRVTCDLLRTFLGVGTVRWYPRRAERFKDVVVYALSARADLVDRVIPFMDSHLPPCHKRQQYDVWRDALLTQEPGRRAGGRPRG